MINITVPSKYSSSGPMDLKVRKPFRIHRMKSKADAAAVARVIRAANKSWTTELHQLPVSKDWQVWATNGNGRIYILSGVHELEDWFKVQSNWLTLI